MNLVSSMERMCTVRALKYMQISRWMVFSSIYDIWDWLIVQSRQEIKIVSMSRY